MAFDYAPIPAADALVDDDKLVTQAWIEFFNSQSQIGASAAQSAGGANVGSSTASIAATDLGVTSTAGRYRIGYYMEVLTAAVTSSSTQIQFTWSSNGISKTFTSAAMNGNTTTTYQQDTILVNSDASAPITYAVSYASNPAGTMEYALYITLEKMP